MVSVILVRQKVQDKLNRRSMSLVAGCFTFSLVIYSKRHLEYINVGLHAISLSPFPTTQLIWEIGPTLPRWLADIFFVTPNFETTLHPMTCLGWMKIVTRSCGREVEHNSESESTSNILDVQQTQNICITFIQRRLNVCDVSPTLYKCYTNVLCLLGRRQRH